MENVIHKVLLSEKDICSICQRLGAEISNDYKDKGVPIIIGLLKGCMPFMADLTKYITIPIQIDYMQVSSYDGATSSDLEIKHDFLTAVNDRHVIIVDDIVDTGKTLSIVTNIVKTRGAKTVEVVAMLDKPCGRATSFAAKYTGTTIESGFVIGYGLDYKELYRNLPFVGILKKEIYEGGDQK